MKIKIGGYTWRLCSSAQFIRTNGNDELELISWLNRKPKNDKRIYKIIRTPIQSLEAVSDLVKPKDSYGDYKLRYPVDPTGGRFSLNNN